jgi:hypothetical protein
MVARSELRDDFKEQADWRRETAEQHPDDKRHLEAAATFDRLAATPSILFLKTYSELSQSQT